MSIKISSYIKDGLDCLFGRINSDISKKVIQNSVQTVNINPSKYFSFEVKFLNLYTNIIS